MANNITSVKTVDELRALNKRTNYEFATVLVTDKTKGGIFTYDTTRFSEDDGVDVVEGWVRSDGFGQTGGQLAGLESTAAEIDAVVNGSGVPVYGTAMLPTNFTVPTDGVFHHVTGLTVTLPAAGTYRIDSVIRSGIVVTTGVDYITAKLWNDTTGAYMLDTEVMLAYQNGAGTNQSSTTSFGYVTVTTPTVLVVDAKLYATAVANIYANTNGQTYMSYSLQK
jgi:hypothetical protein